MLVEHGHHHGQDDDHQHPGADKGTGRGSGPQPLCSAPAALRCFASYSPNGRHLQLCVSQPRQMSAAAFRVTALTAVSSGVL